MNPNTPQADGSQGLNDAKQPNAIWIQAEGTRIPTEASVHRSPKRKSTQHKTFLLTKKSFLEGVLSSDVSFILNKVHEKKIVTDRDYKQLKNGEQSPEVITKLVDLVRGKGEDHCSLFLALLRDNQDIREQFPGLRKLDWDSLNTLCATSSTPAPSPSTSAPFSSTSAPSSSTPVPSSSIPVPSPSTPTPSPALEPASGISLSSNSSLQVLTGYIHNVSTVKRGQRKKYFEVVIQQEKECCRVLCFRTKLRECFAEAESKRIPVKLENVKPSKTINGQMLFTDFSKFSPLPPDSLSFCISTDHNLRTRDASLDDLQDKENFEGKKVNVTVEVVQLLKHGHRLTRMDTYHYLPMEEYSVADLTADATLTVWDRNPKWDPLEEGGWVRVTDVSVRDYHGSVRLQTTKDSWVSRASSRGRSATSRDVTRPETLTGRIVGCALSEEHTCPDKHLVNMGRPHKPVACEKCSMNYHVSSLTRIVSGEIKVKTSDSVFERLKVEDSTIRRILGAAWVEKVSLDQIQNGLFQLRSITFTVLDNHVLSAEVLVQ